MSQRVWSQAIEERWYGRPGWLLLLSPFEWLFSFVAKNRKKFQIRKSSPFSVPVVVVGNICVGGTGKTPTLIALVKYLQKKGHRPGVVSRGYGRSGDELVLAKYAASVDALGDEPSIIYRATKCDVAVGKNRVEAIEVLVKRFRCDVILADDGLQHYNMARDMEIAVVDADRLFGNGHLLPVGPLRELPERLDDCDWVLVNSTEGEEVMPLSHDHMFPISVAPMGVTQLQSGDTFSLDKLNELENITAIAGLGNPGKFFRTLDALDVHYTAKSFGDHHRYTAEDLQKQDSEVLLMTEKDAVKCKALVDGDAYYLEIRMQLPDTMLEEFYQSLQSLIERKKS